MRLDSRNMLTSVFTWGLCLLNLLDFSHQDTEIHGNLLGFGVCAAHLNDTKPVQVYEMKLEDEYTWRLCWNFPPWCWDVYQRTIYKFDPAVENIPHEHMMLKCCDGWKLNMNATGCLPICSSHCLKGFCIHMNVCSRCEPDYTGVNCDIKQFSKLMNSTYASYRRCQCPNDNYVCDRDAQCECAPGFEGPDCQVLSEPGAYILPPTDKPPACSYYIAQVALFLGLLVMSLVYVIFVLKKRYYNNFEPLDNSLPSSSSALNREEV